MGQPFVGEIRMFGGNFPPSGWAFCDGQTMSIAENDVLFQLIGTTFGGDGQQTFNLPDLRGRLPVHQGNSLPLGSAGGVESVILTPQQLPAHTHAAMASAQPATDVSPSAAVPASWGDNQYTANGTTGTFDASFVGPAGGNQPHDNRSPYTAVSFIISLYGVFPSPA